MKLAFGRYAEREVVEVRREGSKMHYKLYNPKTLQDCLMISDEIVEQMEKTITLHKWL